MEIQAIVAAIVTLLGVLARLAAAKTEEERDEVLAELRAKRRDHELELDRLAQDAEVRIGVRKALAADPPAAPAP